MTSFFIDRSILWLLFALLCFLPIVGHGDALVYLCFFSLCVSLGFVIDVSKNTIVKKIFFALLIALFSVFAGLRNFGIGVDTNVYIMKYFNEANYVSSIRYFFASNFNGDAGFLLLACISRYFSEDPQFFLFCIAVFIYSFTFLAAAKFRQSEKNFSWFIFLFIWLFTLFHESLNAMRQYCAMSILMMSFVLLWNNKWLKALSLIIPAYFFHSSSIVFLLIFVFYMLSFLSKKKRLVLSCVFLLVCSILTMKFFDVLPFLENSGFVSETYAENYGAYSKYESMNLFGPSFLVMYSIICYAIWKVYKAGYFSDQTLMITIGIHSFYFVFRLAAFSVVYLNRLSTYFRYCDILLLSIFLTKKIVPQKIRILLYLCMVYAWYKGFISFPGAATYPYKSSILGITEF